MALLGGFAMENILVIFPSGYFFLPPVQNTQGFFLILYLENLAKFLKVKPTKACPSHWLILGPQEFLTLKLIHSPPPAGSQI